MTNLFIQKTRSTPEIDFKISGELIITGRSLPEDVHRFYDPIVDWIEKLECENLTLDLKLEYLNTSSTKKILTLLLTINENLKIKNITVNWYYESDDMEMEDLGLIYEEDVTRAKFNFIEGVDLFD
ncbi:MAG: DUF1987 domain-containing protein [Bacteroidales bacterium]|nr:DUF1987 domain-containing protein [Bacteroidales bacterium]